MGCWNCREMNKDFRMEKMIIQVDHETIQAAAVIHSASWKESHAAFCSEQFIRKHTVENQKAYLLNEMKAGKKIYMLVDKFPVGIVSVKEDLIENLYVLPIEQHRGYGTELLQYAIATCLGIPRLWVLDCNTKAHSLYMKSGFIQTGNQHILSDNISEVEMELKRAVK